MHQEQLSANVNPTQDFDELLNAQPKSFQRSFVDLCVKCDIALSKVSWVSKFENLWLHPLPNEWQCRQLTIDTVLWFKKHSPGGFRLDFFEICWKFWKTSEKSFLEFHLVFISFLRFSGTTIQKVTNSWFWANLGLFSVFPFFHRFIHSFLRQFMLQNLPQICWIFGYF